MAGRGTCQHTSCRACFLHVESPCNMVCPDPPRKQCFRQYYTCIRRFIFQSNSLPILVSTSLSVWFGYLSMLVVAWGGSNVPMLNRSLHPTLLPLGLAGLASTIRLVTVRLQSLTSSTSFMHHLNLGRGIVPNSNSFFAPWLELCLIAQLFLV